MSVEKNVKIKVISTICPIEGDEETYELWLQGVWLKKNSKMYLRYEEVIEDQTIRTTVKMNNDDALILRSGAVNMRCLLAQNVNKMVITTQCMARCHCKQKLIT